jgi:hypothetical protein
MTDSSPERTLGRVAEDLARRGQRFALVGGMAVSIRSEVRFTRDVDLAVSIASDAATEELVRDLTTMGYLEIAIVEHTTRDRLATVRLRSPTSFVVDLLTASSGIEGEVVERAEPLFIEGAGTVPVARCEELLALKILSMTDAPPQDRMDARSLLASNPGLDLAAVRELLALITTRSFHRGQDLTAKLDGLVTPGRAGLPGPGTP